MLSIENTLISDSIISEDFVCNISKCKGECCVAGEAGAPLEKDEVRFLEQNYSKIKLSLIFKVSESDSSLFFDFQSAFHFLSTNVIN